MSNHHRRDTITHGVALTLYPIFLGFAPVLGKFALNGQSDPFTVAALRTLAAAGMLWIIYLLFWRKYIYIYPAGLLGCIVIGTVNGIGSLFYYNGLSYLNASVAQLLNATYLIFVVILAAVDGQKLNGRTVLRVILAFTAVAIITQGQAAGGLNWHGIGLMIGNAILFAGTFMLGQRVTYEMPSPTVALYVMTTMAVVVVIARIIINPTWTPQTPEALGAIAALGITTALSRLLMFFGIKKSGSLQTVLIGITETGVSLVLAFLLLGDQLSLVQWVGVGILAASLLLIRRRDVRRLTGELPLVPVSGMGITSLRRLGVHQRITKQDAHPHELKPDSKRDTQPNPRIQAATLQPTTAQLAANLKIYDDVTPEEAEMIRRMLEGRSR